MSKELVLLLLFLVGEIYASTKTPTPTISPSPSPTSTSTSTSTPTSSSTPSPTSTATSTSTSTPTSTATPTPTPTSTPTSTATPTSTPSPTPSSSATPTSTISPTSTPTPSSTATPTPTTTPTPTSSSTPTPSSTPTSSSTPTRTPSSTPSTTITPTQTATSVPTKTPSGTPTFTSLPTKSISITGTYTKSNTITSSTTLTQTITGTNTETDTRSRSRSSTLTSTSTPFPPSNSLRPRRCITGGVSLNLTDVCLPLNNQQGCCTPSLSILTPSTISSSCSSACMDLYYSFWCSASCLFPSPKVVCKASIQSLFDACSSCGATPGSSASDWATSMDVISQDGGDCYDLTKYIGKSFVAPTVANVFVATQDTVSVTTPNGTVARFRVVVRSDGPVYFGTFSYINNDDLNSAMTVNIGPFLWHPVAEVWYYDVPIPLKPWGGNLAIRAQSVQVWNGFSTNTLSGNLANIRVTTPLAENQIINDFVQVCKNEMGFDTISAPSGITYVKLRSCSSTVSTIAAKPGSTSILSITINQLIASAPITTFSGVLVSLKDLFQDRDEERTLRTTGGAIIQFDGDIKIKKKVKFTSDSERVCLRIPKTRSIEVSERMSICGTSEIKGKLSAVSKAANIVLGGLVTADEDFVIDSGSNQPFSVVIQSAAASFIKGIIQGTEAINIVSGVTNFYPDLQNRVPLVLPISYSGALCSTSRRRLLQSTTRSIKTCTRTASTKLDVENVFNSGSVLDVQTCTASGCNCDTASTPQTSTRFDNTLKMTPGSTIQLTNVGATEFGVLRVNRLLLESGSTILVNLASNVPKTATSYDLIYFNQGLNADPCNGTYYSVQVNPPQTNIRDWEAVCVNTQSSSNNKIVLQLAAVKTTTTQDPVSYPYASANEYTIECNKVCGTYKEADFISDVSTVLKVATDQIRVSSVKCGSVIFTFRCYVQTNVNAADDLCRQVVSEGTKSGTALNQRVQGMTGGQASNSSSGSNTALYALFALMLLPVICLVVCCLFIRNHQRNADNQYMQDTATFSAVAASPQPLGQPPFYSAQNQPTYYDPAVYAKPTPYP